LAIFCKKSEIIAENTAINYRCSIIFCVSTVPSFYRYYGSILILTSVLATARNPGLKGRKGAPVAIKAGARKIAEAYYFLWSVGKFRLNLKF